MFLYPAVDWKYRGYGNKLNDTIIKHKQNNPEGGTVYKTIFKNSMSWGKMWEIDVL